MFDSAGSSRLHQKLLGCCDCYITLYQTLFYWTGNNKTAESVDYKINLDNLVNDLKDYMLNMMYALPAVVLHI